MTPGTPAEQWEGRPVPDWQLEWRIPELHIFNIIASTNDVARDRALAGAPAGATVLAETQTAGRGRAGRSWSDAPEKSVMLSVVMRSNSSNVDPTVMPIFVGHAVARAIENVARVRVLIKWPNDLMLENRRKIGGILCEGALAQDASWLVAGIGLNVLQQPSEFPSELQHDAASLLMTGVHLQRALLVKAILDALRPFHIRTPPLDAMTLKDIAARDALIGYAVSIDGEPAGIAAGIAADGTLQVSTPLGMKSVRIGTVRFDTPRAGADRAGVSMITIHDQP